MKTSEDYAAPVPKSVVAELRAYKQRSAKRTDTGTLSTSKVRPEEPIFGLSPASALPAWMPIFIFATIAMVRIDRIRT